MKSSKALRAIVLCMLCALCVLLSACVISSGSHPADKGEAAASSADPAGDASLLEIGNGAVEQYFDVSNATEMTIVGLAVKDAQAEDYPESQQLSGFSWEPGKVARVHFDPQSAQQASPDDNPQASEREYDVAFRQLFSILLTFSDGSTGELHSVNLDALQDATLEYADEVYYLSYTDDAGIRATTLDAEKAILAQAQEANEAQEAAAEEPAPETSQAPVESNEYSYDNSSPPASSPPPAVSQDSDACVTDPIFR
ncbi:MAG: hypothetical protein LBC23_04650 [Coriobacteriales bacterium]|jgi:hypothetical protein|nr:hypothetical protein [Coriobacteriales bacterium]